MLEDIIYHYKKGSKVASLCFWSVGMALWWELWKNVGLVVVLCRGLQYQMLTQPLP